MGVGRGPLGPAAVGGRIDKVPDAVRNGGVDERDALRLLGVRVDLHAEDAPDGAALEQGGGGGQVAGDDGDVEVGAEGEGAGRGDVARDGEDVEAARVGQGEEVLDEGAALFACRAGDEDGFAGCRHFGGGTGRCG